MTALDPLEMQHCMFWGDYQTHTSENTIKSVPSFFDGWLWSLVSRDKAEENRKFAAAVFLSLSSICMQITTWHWSTTPVVVRYNPFLLREDLLAHANTQKVTHKRDLRDPHLCNMISMSASRDASAIMPLAASVWPPVAGLLLFLICVTG